MTRSVSDASFFEAPFQKNVEWHYVTMGVKQSVWLLVYEKIAWESELLDFAHMTFDNVRISVFEVSVMTVIIQVHGIHLRKRNLVSSKSSNSGSFIEQR